MNRDSMSREVSASFQAVEDWLRSLGLLHYAQSFYDNGYEDIETCKLMKEQDLNVIDIKNDQDRSDILSAIHKLQQNLYFELEPESNEKTIERTKIESIALKSTLKECLEREKIQLTEPPYYNTDGTVGDLYPLAIRYAAELNTFFDDVLEALEQLRKRQLPTRNYDIMAIEESETPSKLRRDQENRRSLRNVSNPAEYLNCETPGCKRSSSFSKYDTRVTKSTTDLTKDNINTSGGSGGGGSPKSKSKKTKGFLGGVFKRSATTRTVHTTLKPQDFKASELQLSQDEIKNIFHQVKNKEISQEDALDVIKRRGLTKSTSYDGSPECTHHPIHERASLTITSLLPKDAAMLGKIKSKSMKDPLRNRCASAQFYTKGDDISQSSTSLVSNGSKSSLEISGDHTGSVVDEDSSSIGSENSPEGNKHAVGIFKKIRNSMRKKKLTEDESPTDEKGLFLQNGTCSPPEGDLGKEDCVVMKSLETDNLFFTPIFPPPPNIPPPPPPMDPPPPPPPSPRPPMEYMSDETQMEDIAFRDRTPSLKIKSYPMNQEVISKRRALEKNNNIPKDEMNINLENNLDTSNIESESYIESQSKCNQIELTTELNKVVPKIPPRPAPRRPSAEDSMETLPTVPPRRSKIFRAESTERQMDELVKEMNDIEAELDIHLQHVSSTDEDNKPEIIETEIKKTDFKRTKRPESSVKASTIGWKKPVPPPRPNISGGEDTSSVGSDSSIGSRSPSLGKDTWSLERRKVGKRKVSDLVTNKQWISKKLNREVINLSLLPYTSKNGCWRIPYNLVARYADDLTLPLQEIIKCFEEIRIDERRRMHQLIIPYTEKDLNIENKNSHQTVDEYLLHIGLPMYVEDFREIGIKNVFEISGLDECDIRRLGIFDRNHVTWLLKHSKSIPSII